MEVLEAYVTPVRQEKEVSFPCSPRHWWRAWRWRRESGGAWAQSERNSPV